MTERPDEELQALCDAATEGPWIVTSPVVHVAEVHTIGDLKVTVCTTTGTNWARVDAEFIAAARQAVPSLLARVVAAEKKLAAVAEECDSVHGHGADDLPGEIERLRGIVARIAALAGEVTR